MPYLIIYLSCTFATFLWYARTNSIAYEIGNVIEFTKHEKKNILCVILLFSLLWPVTYVVVCSEIIFYCLRPIVINGWKAISAIGNFALNTIVK